ncbi:MAG: leucyl/phenylalanyl-tRNA--protein transferase [Planctomycetaceae bacterium]|jgi:leucyl/phenylalanyl-tRNA--protein transferase|nr:leucyl/phenylalanyl-tRNA--protein transferase [Planctomycetaceae bacterium]
MRSKFFPDARFAETDGFGFLGAGLELRVDVLVDAYSHGIFPWPSNEGLIPWCSPEPRAIIPLDAVHISKRLRRTIRSERFAVTIDNDFDGVINGCANVPQRRDECWIIPAMVRAYKQLHQSGYAHSVEVWYGNKLVGGVYGVSVGRFFAGESMFHTVTDASKVALAKLIEHLQTQGCLLFDVQMVTSITSTFGAIEIPREEYLKRLENVIKEGGRMKF